MFLLWVDYDISFNTPPLILTFSIREGSSVPLNCLSVLLNLVKFFSLSYRVKICSVTLRNNLLTSSTTLVDRVSPHSSTLRSDSIYSFLLNLVLLLKLNPKLPVPFSVWFDWYPYRPDPFTLFLPKRVPTSEDLFPDPSVGSCLGETSLRGWSPTTFQESCRSILYSESSTFHPNSPGVRDDPGTDNENDILVDDQSPFGTNRNAGGLVDILGDILTGHDSCFNKN